MSFSSDIKARLCEEPMGAMHCVYSELAGMLRFSGKMNYDIIRLSTEHESVARRFMQELWEGFSLRPEVSQNAKTYNLCISNPDAIANIREGILLDYRPVISCCRGAYIRGAFLAGGSVSDPKKGYHLEFDTKEHGEALILQEMLEAEGFISKLTERKDYYIVYIKECDKIAQLLGFMGAVSYGFELFNVQAEKDVRNNVNRRVNCENANADKAARASSKHLQAIRHIQKCGRWSKLPDVLREIGELRLEYPEDSLKELGEKTDPPIGKSGVNHRLNRIIEFSKEI